MRIKGGVGETNISGLGLGWIYFIFFLLNCWTKVRGLLVEKPCWYGRDWFGLCINDLCMGPHGRFHSFGDDDSTGISEFECISNAKRQRKPFELSVVMCALSIPQSKEGIRKKKKKKKDNRFTTARSPTDVVSLVWRNCVISSARNGEPDSSANTRHVHTHTWMWCDNPVNMYVCRESRG